MVNNNIFRLLSALFLILNFSIYANDTPTIKLEWKAVKNSNGYLLQIKNDITEEVKEQSSENHSIEFTLPPGKYSIRVSGLNKFKKPSNWSDWKKTEIIESDSIQNVNLSNESPKEEVKISPNVQKWKWFVPGLTRWQNDQKISASLYWSCFALLSGMFVSEKNNGNHISDSARKQDLYVYPMSIIIPTYGQLYLYNERNNLHHQYEIKQDNQRTIGFVAIILYGISIYDSYRISKAPEKKEGLSFDLNLSPTFSKEVNASQIQGSISFSYSF
jgi:hypothetical protein